MKPFFLTFLLLFTAGLSLSAQTVVDDGTLTTPRGIGGYKEISYAFAKGDVVTLETHSNHLLQRIMITQYPSTVLQRVKGVKNNVTTFTMPDEGFVVIRFISDRNGVARVKYTVTRTPGAGGPADYNTKINWQQPVGTVGGMVPKKAE